MTDILFTLVLALTPAIWQDQIPQGQTAPVPVSSPPTQEVPAPMKLAPAPAPAPMPPTTADRDARRDNITIMEALLASAVGIGARHVQADNPGVTLLPTGQPRARGFVLEGYGVFFDVEIPELNASVELTMQQFQREFEKRLEERTAPDAGARRTAQNLPAVADFPDPGAFYRVAVITAVAGAMLDYSKNLNVQTNEWLTVALRGSELPIASAGFRDSRTVLLRINGSDLADYLASRISKEEAVKRVEKREF